MRNIGDFIFFLVASTALAFSVYMFFESQTHIGKAVHFTCCAMDFIYMQRAWAKAMK